MSNKGRGAAVLVALILGVSSVWFVTQTPGSKPAEYQQQRVLRFKYQVNNPSNRLLKDAWLKTYLPLAVTANQRVSKVKASLPYELITDDSGNQIAHIDLGTLSPFGKRTVDLTVVVDTATEPNKSQLRSSERFLASEEFVDTSDNTIVGLAKTLIGASQAESVKNISEWVNSNIRFTGYREQDQGAAYAIEQRSGDSTENMYLVVALARALNIPARPVGGFVYADNKLVNPSDYHNWAEVFIDDAWRHVDAQNGVVMENSENYIVVRLIGSSNLVPMRNSHQFVRVSDGLTL